MVLKLSNDATNGRVQFLGSSLHQANSSDLLELGMEGGRSNCPREKSIRRFPRIDNLVRFDFGLPECVAEALAKFRMKVEEGASW